MSQVQNKGLVGSCRGGWANNFPRSGPILRIRIRPLYGSLCTLVARLQCLDMSIIITVLTETPSHDASQLQWSHYVRELLSNLRWCVPGPERVGLLIDGPLATICVIVFTALIDPSECFGRHRSLTNPIPCETAATTVVFVGATKESFLSVFMWVARKILRT